jgi:hypothetical protein
MTPYLLLGRGVPGGETISKPNKPIKAEEIGSIKSQRPQHFGQKWANTPEGRANTQAFLDRVLGAGYYKVTADSPSKVVNSLVTFAHNLILAGIPIPVKVTEALVVKYYPER